MSSKYRKLKIEFTSPGPPAQDIKPNLENESSEAEGLKLKIAQLNAATPSKRYPPSKARTKS